MSLKRTLPSLFLALLFLQSSSIWGIDVPPAFNPRLSVKGEAAKYLQEIEIRNIDGSVPDFDTTLEVSVDGLIRVHLGLGNTTAKKITLKPASQSSLEFRVEQQYETSLTLMDEGPHMDLLDWKHHLSGWSELEKTGDLEFLSNAVASDEFPQVNQADIIEAVRAETKRWSVQGFDQGDRWIDMAKQCQSSTTSPCGVSVSKIRIKIKVKDAGEWRDIQTIEIHVPMGC